MRVVFRSRATMVKLATSPTKRVYVGAPPRPDGVYDLLVDGRLAGQVSVPSGKALTIDMTTGASKVGLGGSAPLDPFVARVLRDVRADAISIKSGINLVNADPWGCAPSPLPSRASSTPSATGTPKTPFLVVSPIFCPIHEDTPGPSAPDLAAVREGKVRFRATGDPAERARGKLTLNVIRDELARIVAQRAAADPNLHYLDGRALYKLFFDEDTRGRPRADETRVGDHDQRGHRAIVDARVRGALLREHTDRREVEDVSRDAVSDDADRVNDEAFVRP